MADLSDATDTEATQTHVAGTVRTWASARDCADVERLLNLWMDQGRFSGADEVEVGDGARSGPDVGVGHARDCPACQDRVRQFQTLDQALGVWLNNRNSNRDFDRHSDADSARTERVLEWVRTAQSRRRRATALAWTGAVLAALLLVIPLLPLAVNFGLGRSGVNPRTGTGIAVGDAAATGDGATPSAGHEGYASGDPPRERTSLNLALAQFGEATLSLAKEASQPAQRITRTVVQASFVESAAPADSSPPSPQVGNSEVLETVGKRVKPLTLPAREAFEFLIPDRSSRKAPDSR